MDHATHLGLDVHKDTIAVAILRPDHEVPDERVIPNTPEALRKLVGRRRGRLVACYEAGPTGYETHRLLSSVGVPCDVIAPTLIPRRAGRRVKTDRLDARNLARLHRAGELTAIRVPTSEEEALRDLIRVREDLKDDRRKTMHRVKSFLLRQGRRYPGKARGWTDKFDLWVRGQRFAEPAADAAFRHYLAALDTRRAQLRAIDAEIEAAAGQPPPPEVRGLRARVSRPDVRLDVRQLEGRLPQTLRAAAPGGRVRPDRRPPRRPTPRSIVGPPRSSSNRSRARAA
jgi:transposase